MPTPESAQKKEPTVRAGLCAYSRPALEEVGELISQAGIAGIIEVKHYDLATMDLFDCDMAMVVFDLNPDINQYKHDLALLKVVKKIQVVMLLVKEEHRQLIDDNKSDLAADDIFYLPMSQANFIKIILTHAASIKIARERESGGTGYARNKATAFGQTLVHNKIINALQLKKALDHQKRLPGKRLGDVLVELGYIDEDQKLHFLSSQLDVPLATPRQYASADLNVVSLVPEYVARRYSCVPLEKNGGELCVAMTDVLDLRLLDSLRDMTDLSIKPLLGDLSDITTSIDRYYHDITSNKDASALMADLDDKVEFLQDKQEEVNLEEIASAGAELGIVKLVNLLIGNAVRDRASDIHLEPMENELVVRYRIDGDLRRIMSPPRHSHQAIITRIKILSNLNIAERRLPQDGRMVVRMGKREVDIRVSVLPSIFGEKAVLRILDKEAFEKSTTSLGFTQHDLEVFTSQITKPYGMIIVTGPTGSGKSTTLYSALQQVKNVTRNVITVEDPVEFHIEGITQVQANSKIGLTFANALRSILRQDPDIVLIGEIRDEETADIAIKMSLTGHLVFSTLHTNDAAGAIARFVDINAPPLLLASCLNLIVAQRLVRKVCQRCRSAYEPPMELLEQLNLPAATAPTFYRGEGCVACNGTGFYGRTAIFEMLPITKDIRTLILRNSPTMDIQAQAEKEGMKTLRRAGIELALKGETSIEQVIAVTTEL
jgi:type IV pilus assembly protein PilB